jgi:hypothetical protein
MSSGDALCASHERNVIGSVIIALWWWLMGGLRRHQWRMSIAPPANHCVHLGREPQPAVSEVKMRELAFRVCRGVGHLEAFICSCAEFGPGHDAAGRAKTRPKTYIPERGVNLVRPALFLV